MAFGNYFDDEQKGENVDELFAYDRISSLENEQNLAGNSKNINLALKINTNFNLGHTGIH